MEPKYTFVDSKKRVHVVTLTGVERAGLVQVSEPGVRGFNWVYPSKLDPLVVSEVLRRAAAKTSKLRPAA